MMKLLSVVGLRRMELEQLLRKPAFDRVVVGENVSTRIRNAFGADLTPEELVEEKWGVDKYGW